MHRIALVFITGMITSAAAHGVGTLAIGEMTVEGDRVIVPVVLGGDVQSGVSALDFRLQYDPSQYRPLAAEAGAAAVQADKRVMANLSNPGEYIVVMMGMNQKTCAPGEVARVVFERLPGESQASPDLGIARPTLSSVDGDVIESQALPRERTVTPGSDAAPAATEDRKAIQPASPPVEKTASAAAVVALPPSEGLAPVGHQSTRAQANVSADTPLAAKHQGARKDIQAELRSVTELAKQANVEVPGHTVTDGSVASPDREHDSGTAPMRASAPDSPKTQLLNAPGQRLVASNRASGALTIEKDVPRTSNGPRPTRAWTTSLIVGIGVAILAILGSGWILRRKFS